MAIRAAARFLVALSFPSVLVAGGIETPPAHGGFFITANVGGAGFQSADSALSLVLGTTNFNAYAELIPRNSLNFTWGGGLGWQFPRIFKIDLAYMFLNLPLTGYFTNTAQTSDSVLQLENNLLKGTGISNVELADFYIDVMDVFGQNVTYFRPYLGGGLGMAQNKLINTRYTVFTPAISVAISSTTKTYFAYRVIAGLNFDIVHNLQAYTQYSYLYAGKYVFGNNLTGINLSTLNGSVPTPAKFPLYSNILTVGLTYIFRS